MLNIELQKTLIQTAIEEASFAIERGDEPFGGVICDSMGNIIVRDGNRENTEKTPTHHAEMVLIREACKKLGTKDLSGCILVCNAEPCPMCASALILSGIREFYYGASMEPFCNPYIRCKDVLSHAKGDITLVAGIMEKECRAIVEEGRKRLTNK
ncbi:MAG: nucleoside deaminase [Oscillospiraceae bacterium]|nr:nucleoside deaminase [Oscillospiraceae bacterium]